MKILIFMSSLLEMKGILSSFHEDIDESQRLFSKNIGSHIIDFYHSDPGIFSLSYYLTRRLQEVDYDLVINAGIAGSFNEKLSKGTVVQVGSDCFADIGVEENGIFKDLFNMGLIDSNSFPFRAGNLHEDAGTFATVLSELPRVESVTVNRIISDTESMRKLKEAYQPDIETMEGAAFFYVCLMERKKCIQLRSVSNFVGERDKNKWDIKGSLTALGEQINILLNDLQ